MDDFERAIINAIGQMGDSSLQIAGTNFCQRLLDSDDGWRLCLTRLSQTQNNSVRFWCFHVLRETMTQRWEQILEQDRVFVRSTLFSYIRLIPTLSLPPYIKNAFAVVLVRVLKVDYPARWPSFFTDLISLLNELNNSHSEFADIYIRVLNVIDEEIAGPTRLSNSESERYNATLIKDSMRVTCLPAIITSCRQLLNMYINDNPYLAASVLEVLAKLATWAETPLFLEPNLAQMLIFLLNSRNCVLVKSSCHCLLELVNKSMKPDSKLSLIRDLSLCFALDKLRPSELDLEHSENLSHLINAITTQLIDIALFLAGCVSCYDCNDMLSFSESDKNDCHSLLTMSLNIVLRYFSSENSSIVIGCCECVSKYITFARKTRGGLIGCGSVKTGHVTLTGVGSHTCEKLNECYLSNDNDTNNNSMDHVNNNHSLYFLHSVMSLSCKHFQYPTFYNFDRPEDQEENFMQFRKQIEVIFRKISTVLCPCVSIKLCHDEIVNTLSQQSTWTEQESAVNSLYILGEAVPCILDFSSSQDNSLLLDTMFLIIKADSSRLLHVELALSHYRLFVRFWKWLEISQPDQNSLQSVLLSFLGVDGLSSVHQRLRSGSAYLLLRLIKSFSLTLKRQIAPYAKELICMFGKSIQDVHRSIMLPNENNINLTCDDSLYLCELLGIIVSPLVVCECSNVLLDDVIKTFITELDGIRESLRQKSNITEHRDFSCKHAAMVISSIASVSKAFKGGSKGMHIQASQIFSSAFNSVLQFVTLFPHHSDVQSQAIFLMHRMIACLSTSLVPAIPPFLSSLIPVSASSNIDALLRLVIQLVREYKGSLREILPSLIPSLVDRIYTILDEFDIPQNLNISDSDSNSISIPSAAYSAQRVQFDSFFKLCVTVFFHILSCDLSDCLITPQSVSQFPRILLLFVRSGIRDFSTLKLCFQTLSKCVDCYANKNITGIDIQSFLCGEASSACIRTPLLPYFNENDISCLHVLSDISIFQRRLFNLYGDNYIQRLSTFLCAFQCRRDLTEEYLSALSENEATFSSFLRYFVQTYKKNLLHVQQ